MRHYLRAAAVLAAAIALSGCVVAAPGPGPGPERVCPYGSHWVRGFTGAYGVFHPPHCAPY